MICIQILLNKLGKLAKLLVLLTLSPALKWAGTQCSPRHLRCRVHLLNTNKDLSCQHRCSRAWSSVRTYRSPGIHSRPQAVTTPTEPTEQPVAAMCKWRATTMDDQNLPACVAHSPFCPFAASDISPETSGTTEISVVNQVRDARSCLHGNKGTSCKSTSAFLTALLRPS